MAGREWTGALSEAAWGLLHSYSHQAYTTPRLTISGAFGSPLQGQRAFPALHCRNIGENCGITIPGGVEDQGGSVLSSEVSCNDTRRWRFKH